MQEDRFDVVVVGGGITGAGVALDAASRGYSVALVERDDFGKGTSSRSSKMVHGGLRYLQNFDLGLVREALLERQLLVQLAPHLVYPTPFLVPAVGEERRDRRIGIGLNMYDVMATLQDRAGAQPAERALGGCRLLGAGPPSHDLGRGGGRAGPRPRSARADLRLSVLRLPDGRRSPGPHSPWRGGAVRRRGGQRRRGDRGARRRRSGGRSRLHRGGIGRASRGARRQCRERDGRLGRPDPARRAARPRRRSRRSAPAAALT